MRNINLYQILHSSQDAQTGSITSSIGNANNEVIFNDNVEHWGPCGLISIPPNITPNSNENPMSLSLEMGDNDIIFAYKYVAGQALAGSLAPGDTCLYANGADNDGSTKITLSGSSNNIHLTNGSATLDMTGSIVKIGTGTDYVAKALPTQAIITALNNLQAAVAAVPTPITGAALGALMATAFSILTDPVASTNLKCD